MNTCESRKAGLLPLLPIRCYYRIMLTRIHKFTRNRLCFAMLFAFTLPIDAAPKPITVKVVVVAMFEIGQDSGDQPGELQYWVERDHLDQGLSSPRRLPLCAHESNGEMAILTGQGTAHAAATIMALGLDPASTSATPTGSLQA